MTHTPVEAASRDQGIPQQNSSCLEIGEESECEEEEVPRTMPEQA